MNRRTVFIVGIFIGSLAMGSVFVLSAIPFASPRSDIVETSASSARSGSEGDARTSHTQKTQAVSQQSGERDVRRSAILADVIATESLDFEAYGSAEPAQISNAKLVAFLDVTAHDRIPDDIDVAIPNLKSQVEFLGVRRLVLDKRQPDEVRNEGMTLLRRSGDPALEKLLEHVASATDESNRMRAFAVQHLGISYGNGLRSLEVMLERLAQAGPMEARREALWALVAGESPRALQLTTACWQDSAWADHRDILIAAYQSLNVRDRISYVREALDGNDSCVIAAITTLAQWDDRESLPHIESISSRHQNFRVRRIAGTAVKKLTRGAKVQAKE